MKKILALLFLFTISGATLLASPGAGQGFALEPKKDYEYTPDEFDMKWDVHKIPTEDGLTLNGWFFPCVSNPSSREFILISHDGKGNIGSQDKLERVHRLISNGFNVMIYDYRGFGESSPFVYKPNTYIVPHLIKDVHAMMKYMHEKMVSSFHIYGYGVGGGLTLGLGIHNVISKHKMIIAESPFFTLEDQKKKVADAGQGDIRIPPIGYDKQFEPLYALDIPAPVALGILIIAAENDLVCNPKMVKTLKAKQSKLVTIQEVPETTQEDIFTSDKDRYIKYIIDYINNTK